MGVAGLLQALKSITHDVQLSELKGLTVGVDAYCWLHRGAYACSQELAQGVQTDKFVKFCMKRVEQLIEHGIVPWLVFDGAPLPMKEGVNTKRRERRKDSALRGEAAELAGEMAAARVHYTRAVSITSGMARELIKELVRRGIKYTVAPYEADAQLAYLSQQGLVDAVITEDSDALPYSCKRVLFKLDNDGAMKEIRRRELGANESPSLAGWTYSMFLDMCLLAGCDYLPSVHGIGISTAHKLVARHRTHRAVLAALRSSSNFSLPDGFEELYEKARLTFRHQTVYDPRSRTTVPLLELSQVARDQPNLDFLGPILSPDVAEGVATSRRDPMTKKEYPDPLSVPVVRCRPVDVVPPEGPSSQPQPSTHHSHGSQNRSQQPITHATPIVVDPRPHQVEPAGATGSHTSSHHQQRGKDVLVSFFKEPSAVDRSAAAVDNRNGGSNSRNPMLFTPPWSRQRQGEADRIHQQQGTIDVELPYDSTEVDNRKHFSPVSAPPQVGSPQHQPKFIPPAAHHFECTTVSDTLETLQRRRRKTGRGGGGVGAVEWLREARQAEGLEWEQEPLYQGPESRGSTAIDSGVSRGGTRDGILSQPQDQTVYYDTSERPTSQRVEPVPIFCSPLYTPNEAHRSSNDAQEPSTGGGLGLFKNARLPFKAWREEERVSKVPRISSSIDIGNWTGASEGLWSDGWSNEGRGSYIHPPQYSSHSHMQSRGEYSTVGSSRYDVEAKNIPIFYVGAGRELAAAAEHAPKINLKRSHAESRWDDRLRDPGRDMGPWT